MPSTLTPFDAYAAIILPDGTVTTTGDFSDPNSKPVIVAHFELSELSYTGIYHDDLDKWEIAGENDFWKVVSDCDEFYGYAQKTVEHFKDKLLSGPNSDLVRRQLSKKMMQEMQAEMDKDIIKSLYLASGHTPPVRRLLNARWTVEKEKELKTVMVGALSRITRDSTGTVIKSRLINKKS